MTVEAWAWRTLWLWGDSDATVVRYVEVMNTGAPGLGVDSGGLPLIHPSNHLQVRREVQIELVAPRQPAHAPLPAALVLAVGEFGLHHRLHHYASRLAADATVVDHRADLVVLLRRHVVVLHHLHDAVRHARVALALLPSNAANGVRRGNRLWERGKGLEGRGIARDERTRDFGCDLGVSLKCLLKRLLRVHGFALVQLLELTHSKNGHSLDVAHKTVFRHALLQRDCVSHRQILLDLLLEEGGWGPNEHD